MQYTVYYIFILILLQYCLHFEEFNTFPYANQWVLLSVILTLCFLLCQGKGDIVLQSLEKHHALKSFSYSLRLAQTFT